MTHPDHQNALLSGWTETLHKNEARPAVIGPDGTVLRTYRDLESETGLFTPLLEGLNAGNVVVVQLPNCAAWPALLLALFRHGLIPLPLGQHLQKAELQVALETCRASALITMEDGKIRLNRCAFSALSPPTAEFLKLTSGTTAAPRAIRFQTAQLVADCDQICATMGFGAADLNFGLIPFSHSYGFSNLITPLLCRGVSLVTAEDRLPRAILAALTQTNATVFPGTPIFFQTLADLPYVSELPALRLCISAGAPLSAAVAEQFTRKFGIKIHVFYGSSECGGIAYDATNSVEYRDQFVGLPMKGATLEARTADETTQITVRSPAVASGYFPEDDQAMLGNGGFTPNDLLRKQDDGWYLAGRAADLINIAGRKLNPAELESRLAHFPGVRQVVVFGVQSALRGEEPVACLAGKQLNAAEISRWCSETLSPWQIPRDFWIVPEIRANDRGKISRRLLAEEYLSLRQSGPAAERHRSADPNGS